MLAGMEGLIAAMHERAPAIAVARPAPGERTPPADDEHDDVLAAAPWQAIGLPPSSPWSASENPGLAPGEPQGGLARGTSVGRHVVLQRLGAGGMGVVYAAYDPELDRKVALKLLLAGATTDTGRTRLLREAQALGKVAHPNIVAIHDVGTIGEQVWLAMEFVQGQTLGAWLETPRGWREVVGVMRSAGEGLAAAHAAGLLHRDFKPDNVMVGDDGRVRVMDFGLACVHPDAVLHETDDSEATPTLDVLTMDITRASAIVGTPSYMAPEQFGSAEVTAAADQFAFCVSLWEALYGERPFYGRTPIELVGHVLGQRLRAPAKGRSVPGWLRRACVRGLSSEPQQRWPSMDALLDTLAKGRTRARMRKGLAAVGVLAMVAAGVEGHRRYDVAQRIAACEASGAEIEDVWNPERQQRLRNALVATNVSDAAATADKVMPWLDRHAEAWREARVESCLDAEVRDRWSAEMLDRSLWCLDEHRMELESLVDRMTVTDASTVRRAVPLAARLESVAPCRDTRVLEVLIPPTVENREAIRQVQAQVIRAAQLSTAERHDEGLAVAREAHARAQTLDWEPLAAETGYRLGWLLNQAGAYAEAERVLEDAYFTVPEGMGASEVAADAAIALVHIVGLNAKRPTDGLRWGRFAKVALASIHDGEGLGRATLYSYIAAIHSATSNYDQAKSLATQALMLREQAFVSDHPMVAASLDDLAYIEYLIGNYDRAEAFAKRALSMWERMLGPTHPEVVTSLEQLAQIYHETGAYDQAKVHYEQALAIWKNALGPEHLKVARILNNLALVLLATGAHDQAKTSCERAISIWEKAHGPEHSQVVLGLHNLALVHSVMGAHDQAKLIYERTLSIQEKALPPENSGLAYSFVGLATVALAQHRPIDAIALAQRAVFVREQGDVPAEELAEARFVLARSLWDAPPDGGHDRARAVPLAEQARDAFRQARGGWAKELAEVDRWLAEHAEDR
jgi:eukaryotic-like serine/threonine-protein kinase